MTDHVTRLERIIHAELTRVSQSNGYRDTARQVAESICGDWPEFVEIRDDREQWAQLRASAGYAETWRRESLRLLQLLAAERRKAWAGD